MQRDQAEAAAERGQQVVLVGHAEVHLGRPVGGVTDLHAGVVLGAADPDADRRCPVQDRVRDQLGDAQLGGVHDVVAVETVEHVADPGARLLDRLRLRLEEERLEVEGHAQTRFRIAWSPMRRVTTIAT